MPVRTRFLPAPVHERRDLFWNLTENLLGVFQREACVRAAIAGMTEHAVGVTMKMTPGIAGMPIPFPAPVHHHPKVLSLIDLPVLAERLIIRPNQTGSQEHA